MHDHRPGWGWDDIAIIGMSGRFPGARDLAEYWDNLAAGVESITAFTPEDLAASGVDPAAFDNPFFVPKGSVVEGAERFDANFFGYSPREAESLDPQQRLFLETAWLALEDAGYDPQAFPGLIGVYGGCAMSTYLHLLEANPEFMALLGYLQVYIGNDKDYLTTHVSYKLNLRGPSFSIQTACSTSLLAVAVAADHLLSGQCDMALAGGVCIRAPQETGYYHEPGGIFSPDGHCRVFDADAAGVVFGNGVGVVVLRRLADALADGDAIDAVVRGWAVNNDGAGKASYAAPSLAGQAAVIREAQRRAGIEPETVTYVECHGTGTAVGDPIEIAALTEAFATDRRQFCAVGSVKTNVGHLDPAAGVASLVKTVLALRHRQIPPSLHCERPNPEIDFAASPFYVNRELTEWAGVDGPRRAGVSGFGIGGTNVHLLLEEAPEPPPLPDGRDDHLVVLSARNRPALETMTANLARHLRDHPELTLADVAWTTQAGRRALPQRWATVCRDVDDLLETLDGNDPRRVLEGTAGAGERPVAFMFSGQGTQHVDMARGLYRSLPTFRRALDACADALAPHLDLDLRKLLFPPKRKARAATAQLTRTEFAQPALFAVEYALARLWADLGVEPAAMAGHSIGEYVAACLARVFSLEDALALVAARGRLMQALPEGSMLAVPLGADDLAPWLGDDLDLAAANETALSVASGPTPAIEALAGRLAADGIEGRVLHTSHAFHSGMMEPMLDRFAGLVAGVERHEPAIPYVSNVTGDWVTASEATDPGYWARQVRSPVRWADGLARLLADPQRVLIEVGPGQTLCTFARRHPDRTAGQPVVPSLRHPHEGRADPAFLLESVARLWLAGLPVRWAGLHEGDPRRRVHLPGYPLDRQRFWVEEPGAGRTGPVVVEKEPDMADWFYVPSWDYALAPGEGVAEPDGGPAGGTRWLVFDDGSPVGRAVVADVAARGDPVTVVEAGSVFAKVDDTHFVIDPTRRAHYDDLVAALAGGGGPPHHVLHLWSVGPPDGDWSELPGLEWHEQNGFYSVLYLAQALVAGQVHDAVHLVVASNDMHLVTGEEWLCPAKSLLLGVCKSVSQEYPHLVCRSVDVELADDGDPAECARQLVAEFADPELAPVVAYRHGQRWLQTFEPLPLDEETDPISMLRWQGVYLITGGLGNIGLALASRLATTVCARLVLVGRSGFLPRGEWDDWLWSHEWEDPTSEKIRTLQFIEEQGSEVLILAADVAEVADMRWVLDETYAAYGRLDGVIHGAGNVTPSGFFGVDEADPERCEAQLRPKVQGVATLADVLYDAAPDFVMLVSSLSSVLAGLGYVAYAAANQFMDACAHKYSQATGIPWVSVNWDSWDFTDPQWADPPATQLAMFAEEGAEAFARILSAAMLPQVVVSVGDLAGRMDQWTSLTSRRRAGDDAGGGQGERLYARPDLAVPYVAPRTPVETAIVEVWQDGLGIGQIGVYDNFFADLGGSSLLATQLIARLRDRFHAELPLRRFFDGPTVAELAELVVADTGGAAGELVEAAGS